MARKTIDVETVKGSVNIFLATPDISQDRKHGAASTLELILHETGNYHGFQYLEGWPTDKEFNRRYF